MSEWNDLYLRTSLGETGPYNRAGGLSSPDIIVYGRSPVDPKTFTTPESYAKYYNQPLMQNEPCYIYVRAKNSSPSEPKKGVAYLNMSNPAVVLWPGDEGWVKITTSKGNYASPIADVQPSAIGVTDDPFVFVPAEFGHRCLVSWLSTPDHPTSGDPPKITTMSELAKFLIENPNYAHHNIDIVQDTTGKVSKNAPFTQKDQESNVVFGLEVENCNGFTVSFSSGDLLPDGSKIELEPFTVQTDKKITITIDALKVPAHYQTNIVYTYDQNNLKPPAFSVNFITIFDVGPDDPLFERATPYQELNLAGPLAMSAGRGINVGSIGVMKQVINQ